MVSVEHYNCAFPIAFLVLFFFYVSFKLAHLFVSINSPLLFLFFLFLPFHRGHVPSYCPPFSHKKVCDGDYTWRADGFARMRSAHGYRFSASRSSSSRSIHSRDSASTNGVVGADASTSSDAAAVAKHISRPTASDADAIPEAALATDALTRSGSRHKDALAAVAALLEQHVAERASSPSSPSFPSPSPGLETSAQETLRREHQVEVDDVSREWCVVAASDEAKARNLAAKLEAKNNAKNAAKASARASARAEALGVHGHDYRRCRLDQSTSSKEQEIEVCARWRNALYAIQT